MKEYTPLHFLVLIFFFIVIWELELNIQIRSEGEERWLEILLFYKDV